MLLILRNLSFYRRTHLAVVLGVAAAGAALTGALLVGDSMRASLRDFALARLQGVDYAVRAPRFFRAALAAEIQQPAASCKVAAVLALAGGVTHAATQARVDQAHILGVDERFWKLSLDPAEAPGALDPGRDIILNQALARELQARPGDDVLVRVGRAADVSPEVLLGRRDAGVNTRRLTVRAVIPDSGMGGFGLERTPASPLNAFMSLPAMQRWLGREDGANVLLIGAGAHAQEPAEGLADLRRRMQHGLRLEDLGLRVEQSLTGRYFALESDSALIPPAVEAAAFEAARTNHLIAAPLIAYLASDLTLQPPADASRQIPYSVVCALDGRALGVNPFTDGAGRPVTGIEPGQILLNDWAAGDLQAAEGAGLSLSYLVTPRPGILETRSANFTIGAVITLSGAAADPAFTPEYPGITDTDDMGDWDPPFPVDLKRVRQRDEDYWDDHRTTPKAFIALEDGLRLWSTDTQRFGRFTAIRLFPDPAGSASAAAPGVHGPDRTFIEHAANSFSSQLLQRLDPASMGLAIEPVHEQAVRAGAGNVDFAGLFIGFSMFLIASALMLVGLLFRLGTERRASQVGMLLALGFAKSRVRRLLLGEGAVLAAIGTLVGLAGAIGYAALMLSGLRGWWSQAASAPFVRLHVLPQSLALGGLLTVAVALSALWLALRGLMRQAPRLLLAGDARAPEGPQHGAVPRRALLLIAAVAAAAAAVALLPLMTSAVAEPLGFFGGGVLLLAAALLAVRLMLHLPPRGIIAAPGAWSVLRLGFRNAPRHAGRSLLTVSLMASATFVIAALQSFRLDPDVDVANRSGGAGGFSLLAQASIPLLHDLNTPAGREELGVVDARAAHWHGLTVVPLRLRPGDDASCTNLYVPQRQRIAGASPALIDRGGFAFAEHLRTEASAAENPWSLLRHTFADGAVPAIGDASAVKWQLHSGLGRDVRVVDEAGREQALRFVALLSGSILQDEIIVSEEWFTRLFPSRSGYELFLIETPVGQEERAANLLERELAPFGFDVFPSRQRLAAYFAVQNTYLSLFQTLGGLGLILGTVGLGAVLLRNVWERRRELALLRALGFARPMIGALVFAENLLLVALGLACGVIPALVAVGPHILRHPERVPWLTTLAVLGGVLVAGLASGLLALIPALRAPLLPALRRESAPPYGHSGA